MGNIVFSQTDFHDTPRIVKQYPSKVHKRELLSDDLQPLVIVQPRVFGNFRHALDIIDHVCLRVKCTSHTPFTRTIKQPQDDLLL